MIVSVMTHDLLFYLNKVKQVVSSPSVFVFYNFYYFIFHYLLIVINGTLSVI